MKKYLLSLTASILCCTVSDSVQSMNKKSTKQPNGVLAQSINNLSEEEILKARLIDENSSELTDTINHLNTHNHLVDPNSSKLTNSIEFCDPLKTIKKIEDLAKEIDRIDNELLTAQQLLNENSSNLVTQLESKIVKIKKTIDDLENRRNEIAKQLEISKEALREILEEKFDRYIFASTSLPFTHFCDPSADEQKLKKIEELSCFYYINDRVDQNDIFTLIKETNVNNQELNEYVKQDEFKYFSTLYIPSKEGNFMIDLSNNVYESFVFFNHKNKEIRAHIRNILKSIKSAKCIKLDDTDVIIFNTEQDFHFLTFALFMNEWKFFQNNSNTIIAKLKHKPDAKEGDSKSVMTAFPYTKKILDQESMSISNFCEVMPLVKSVGYTNNFEKFKAELTAALMNHYWIAVMNINRKRGTDQARSFIYTPINNPIDFNLQSEKQKFENQSIICFFNNQSIPGNQNSLFAEEMNKFKQEWNQLKTQNLQFSEISTKAGEIKQKALNLIRLYADSDLIFQNFFNNLIDNYYWSSKAITSDECLIAVMNELTKEKPYYIKEDDCDKLLSRVKLFESYIQISHIAPFIILPLKSNYSPILISTKYSFKAIKRPNALELIVVTSQGDILPFIGLRPKYYPNLDLMDKNRISGDFCKEFLATLDILKKQFTSNSYLFFKQQVESGSLQKQVVAGLKNLSVYNDYLNESENNTRLSKMLNTFNQSLQSKKAHLEKLVQQKDQLNNAQSRLLERRKEDYEKDLAQNPVERKQKVADLQTALNAFNQNIDAFKNVQTDWHNRLLSNKCFFAFDQERYVITSIFFPGSTNDSRADVRKLFSKNNILGVTFVFKELFSDNKHYNVILKEPFWMFVDYLDEFKRSYITQSHTIRLIVTFNNDKQPTIISSFPKDDENYPTLEDHRFYVNNIASDYTEQK